MENPKKVTSVNLSATTIGDSAIVLSRLNRADLIHWLESLDSDYVCAFIKGEGSDNGTSNRLVLASVESGGTPSSTEQHSGSVLPCPAFC